MTIELTLLRLPIYYTFNSVNLIDLGMNLIDHFVISIKSINIHQSKTFMTRAISFVHRTWLSVIFSLSLFVSIPTEKSVYWMPFALARVLSSVALVPRALLSSFFQKIGTILPATHGVNGYFSSIYGGGDKLVDINYLLIITGTSLLIAVLGIFLLHFFKKHSGLV